MNSVAIHTIVFWRQGFKAGFLLKLFLNCRGYSVSSELKMFWASDFKIHIKSVVINWLLKVF